jgi:hypothetical protein
LVSKLTRFEAPNCVTLYKKILQNQKIGKTKRPLKRSLFIMQILMVSALEKLGITCLN